MPASIRLAAGTFDGSDRDEGPALAERRDIVLTGTDCDGGSHCSGLLLEPCRRRKPNMAHFCASKVSPLPAKRSQMRDFTGHDARNDLGDLPLLKLS